MNDSFTPKTRIITIPGSSYKVQLGREGGWVIRILRGLSIISTVAIEEESLVPNNIVTIIQTNLSDRFMPISPYQISRAVTQLMRDVESGWKPQEERPAPKEVGEEIETTVSEAGSTGSKTREIPETEGEISRKIEGEKTDEGQSEGERETISPRMRMPTVLTLLGLPRKEEESEEVKEEAKEAEEEAKESREKEEERTE